MNTYRQQASNTLPLAIIGAVCMGIVAVISFYWMVLYIQYLQGSTIDGLSGNVDTILDIMANFLMAAGAVTAGSALFMERSPLSMTIGVGLLIMEASISFFVELAWVIRNPGSNLVYLIVFFLEVVACIGVLLASLKGTASLMRVLKILVVIASLVSLILILTIYIFEYSSEVDPFIPKYLVARGFISTYWKAILYWITIVTGLIMIILVLSARAGSAGRMAYGQGQPYSRPQTYGQARPRYAQAPAYGQTGMYGRPDGYVHPGGYGQTQPYSQAQGYGQPPHNSGGGAYDRGLGYGQPAPNDQMPSYGRQQRYDSGSAEARQGVGEEVTEILPPEMNGQASEYGQMGKDARGEMRTRPRPGQAPARRQEVGKPGEAFCGNCGAKIRPGADFCTRCGAPLR